VHRLVGDDQQYRRTDIAALCATPATTAATGTARTAAARASTSELTALPRATSFTRRSTFAPLGAGPVITAFPTRMLLGAYPLGLAVSTRTVRRLPQWASRPATMAAALSPELLDIGIDVSHVSTPSVCAPWTCVIQFD
jgi:hypothetical protein